MGSVALTIDVEQDAPPQLNTWQGMEEGLPILLDLLSKYNIPATFFVTGQVAKLYPKQVKEISDKHEVGCHGYEHERFDKLKADEQFRRVKLATGILEKVIGRRILGFRAPKFKANFYTFKALERMGYVYDSSTASYKIGPDVSNLKLVEIPNTLPSSFHRLPWEISTNLVRIFSATLPLTVFDCHVWEVVRMTGIRFDCRFATGVAAIRRLDRMLEYLTTKNVEFKQMREVAESKLKSKF